jgi:hypothetical protein
MATAAKRIKAREATWRRVVAGRARSGMSIRAYCAQCRVKEPAFYWWRAELARRDAAKPKATFVSMVVKAPVVAGTDGICIELRGGQVLRLPTMTVERIVELVRAIEGAT